MSNRVRFTPDQFVVKLREIKIWLSGLFECQIWGN